MSSCRVPDCETHLTPASNLDGVNLPENRKQPLHPRKLSPLRKAPFLEVNNLLASASLFNVAESTEIIALSVSQNRSSFQWLVSCSTVSLGNQAMPPV